MTRDEIFSNELEYLYFRLVAARNALNEAKDPDTESCLWDILSQTLDKIDRKGTEEDRAAAGAIVVRKSNKYARYFLTNQKIVLIAKIITAIIALGTLGGIALVLSGSESKVTPTIVIAAIGAVLITALVIVIKFKTMKMGVALEHLKGKTVIGARINTSARNTSDADSFSIKDKKSQLRVVYNYKGLITVALVVIIAVVCVVALFKYSSELVTGGKNLLAKVGLYTEKTDIDIESYKVLTGKLQNAHYSICYDEAVKCMENSDYENAEKYFSKIPVQANFRDTETKLKEVQSYSNYEAALAVIDKSVCEASTLLKDVPDTFLDAGELKQKWGTLKSFCTVYSNGVEKISIKDFHFEGESLFITIDSVGTFELSKFTSNNVISYKGTPDRNSPEIWWQLSGDELICHNAATQITYKK